MQTPIMQTFIVGGAVRDVLLGLEPKDIDYVAVGYTEADMLNRGYTRVGEDFPVFLDSDGNEHALARTERKSGSGHTGFTTEFDPSVTLHADVVRRDLTINALAVRECDWKHFIKDADPEYVIDHVGGLKDLENKTLKHVSEAFREDPLRVLRVARFSARFDFGINFGTVAMMRDMVECGEVDELTPERVWKEMSRAVMERFPHRFFQVLENVDALNILSGDNAMVFTGLENLLSPLVAVDATEEQRWMAIFNDTDHHSIMGFIEINKLPSALRTSIIFSGQMAKAIYSGVDEIMVVCKRFNLWHDAARLETFVEMYKNVIPISETLDDILGAVREGGVLGFASLSADERKGLSGIEVGEAIAAKRRDVIIKRVFTA